MRLKNIWSACAKCASGARAVPVPFGVVRVPEAEGPHRALLPTLLSSAWFQGASLCQAVNGDVHCSAGKSVLHMIDYIMVMNDHK